jgi:hypothetical protein
MAFGRIKAETFEVARGGPTEQITPRDSTAFPKNVLRPMTGEGTMGADFRSVDGSHIRGGGVKK